MVISSLDFSLLLRDPAVISVGKMPGATQLTPILASARVVAIIRVGWIDPEVECYTPIWSERHDFRQSTIPTLDIA